MILPTSILSTVLPVLVTLQHVGADDHHETTLMTASTDFSQRLYQYMNATSSKVIYSPYSIHSALTMLSMGASGKTLLEMKNVLGLNGLPDVHVHKAYRDLIDQLNSALNVTVDTANAIFANPSVHLNESYVSKASAMYYATSTHFDLEAERGPEAAINDYVALKTHNMITEILLPGTITDHTAMILINTVFFHGLWRIDFLKYGTKRESFNVSEGVKTEVDMMHHPSLFVRYKQDHSRKVDVAELPFEGSRFSLFVALPHEIDGIRDLEDSLTDAGVADLFENIEYKSLKIAFPKFKAEASFNLKGALTSMGMKRAFERGQADFSRISKTASLYVDDIIHKAVIDVREAGVTAAAVTELQLLAVAGYDEKDFKADHPFMYFLRDKLTGQILFQGTFSG